MEELQRILQEMRGYIEQGDYEVAHIDADELLLQAISALASLTGDTDIYDVVSQITKAYGEIGKWYA